MNKMKKMLAIASAAAMLCGSAATMNVSAAGTCDVNGDGEVSITDVLTVNQYLMGVYYLSDPSVLDVNNNYVIDSVDAQQILATSIGNSFTWNYV